LSASSIMAKPIQEGSLLARPPSMKLQCSMIAHDIYTAG
jgi:hypothetical protein